LLEAIKVKIMTEILNLTDIDSNVKNVYEVIAEHFNEKRFSLWDWVESFLDAFPSGSLIYDIGCGPGRNIREGMIGVDNCDNFLKICQEKGKTVLKGSMTSLPLESNSGIGMICIAAFHHLKTEQDRLLALSEFKRVLKPKSRILISIWSIKQGVETKGNRKLKFEYGHNLVPWNNKGQIYQRYYYIFKIDEIKELFEKSELKIINYFWNHGNEVFILES
jgi:ubiquinone/menaquinone biosynthesis C-methylase UbiE